MEEMSEQEKTLIPLSKEEEVWNAKMKELRDFIDLNSGRLRESLGLEKSFKFKVDLLDKISVGLGMTREELKRGYASAHLLFCSGVTFETRPVFDTKEGSIVQMIKENYAIKLAECSNN